MKYYLILLIGVAALSSSAIFVKLISAPAIIIAFYRLLFTLVIVCPVFSANKYRQELYLVTKKQWLWGLIAGILLAFHYVLWFISLNYTSIANSTAIVTLQPLFVVGFKYLFENESISKISLLGCVTAVAGSLIICGLDLGINPQHFLGDLFALVAAAIIAVYFLLGEKFRRTTSLPVYSLISYLGSIILLGIWGVGLSLHYGGYSSQTWLNLFLLAIVSTVLGQMMINYVMKWLSATITSVYVLLEPVGSIILAYIIFHQTISMFQLLGIGLILLGLILFNRTN